MPQGFGAPCVRCLTRRSSHQRLPGGPRALSLSGRRSLRSEQFPPAFERPAAHPLPPPRPAPPRFARLRRYARRIGYAGLAAGALYTIDRTFYASSVARTARTFGVGLVVAADYKLNFEPRHARAGSMEALHARNAARLFDLLRANGGLYLKIGQAIAMQSAVLPPEFQRMFGRMFDDAPQNAWREVARVIEEDFGRPVQQVFGVRLDGEGEDGGAGARCTGVMERRARASASVAQVHWARLPDGREVAVKVQKREIARQVGWDLWAFKVVTYVYSTVFDLPFYSLVPYITERLMLETDFVNEADNGEQMARLVAAEPRLAGRVYIPRVYRELSSRRVLTAEWIEGVRLWDKEGLTAPWRGGRGRGSPGCDHEPLDLDAATKLSASDGWRKPARLGWRGPAGDGGLGVSLKAVMTIMVDLFSSQMFVWGLVHCDPHPGNILIRRRPGASGAASGAPQLVLLDHGLYIQLPPAFRHQYALFWTSLLTFDNRTLARIVAGWGVTNADLFASATLLRPYAGGNRSTARHVTRHARALTTPHQDADADDGRPADDLQQDVRRGVRDLLGDERLWPRELIFLGRNLRIVQGNNQFLGSPVNRIKITGRWASRALVEARDLPLSQRLRNLGRHLLFRLVLFGSDLVFYASKIRQACGWGAGMEDDLERQLRLVAKESLGVELNHAVFEG
ncbi:MAG: hypothetical protein M1826_006654 [Phylliscum demangeonii]|nr:MAG: hypothetical protein M1826_006654 [Phylliscum demangeonii]